MILPAAGAALVLAGIVGGGWEAHQYVQDNLATKDEVIIAGAKADLLLDARLEALIKQRDDIIRKPKKDARDVRDLDYLEKQIDYLRKVQKGQVK